MSRHCLVLRAEKTSPGEEDPYAKALRDANYQPYFVPALQFEYINTEELANDLKHPENFSGLVFTSQNAVEAVSITGKQEDNDQLLLQWKSLPVFVVGKATAKAVNALGLGVQGEISGKANTLAENIIKFYGTTDKSKLKPLLFPCGNLRREELPELLDSAGLALHGITCYNTVVHAQCAKNITQLVATHGPPEWIIFFSPSGVQFSYDTLVSAIPSLEGAVKIAVIGPTTAVAVRDYSLTVTAVAQSPTPASLLDAMQNCNISLASQSQ